MMMMKYTILYIINNIICSRCYCHYLIEKIFKCELSSHVNLLNQVMNFRRRLFLVFTFALVLRACCLKLNVQSSVTLR